MWELLISWPDFLVPAALSAAATLIQIGVIVFTERKKPPDDPR
jgi:hypothetical protein